MEKAFFGFFLPRSRNMPPNAAGFFRSLYFDEERYLSNKTNALNAQTYQGKHWTVEDTATAIAEAGLSPWEHFARYGAFEYAADGSLGINPGSLFDVDSYYGEKIQQCQKDLGVTYTKDDLAEIFRDAGLDPVTHYALYGYAEDEVNPEAEATAPPYAHASQVELYQSLYFNEEQYIANKTDALNAQGAEGKSWTTADTATAFAEAGLTAWEHFTHYGAFERAADGGFGIDPGEYFDLDRYYQDKTEQYQEDKGITVTPDRIVETFREAGLDPITYYALQGYLDGITPVMENLPSIDGSTLTDVPLSGNALIDSLLFTGWNDNEADILAKDWNKIGAEQENVLYYTFPQLSSVQDRYIGMVAPDFSALNSQQKAGYEAALDAASDVTGITFQYTSDTDKANLYFFSARDPDPDEDGITLGWTQFSELVDDKVAVILNSPSVWPDNADPVFGKEAFATVVHELGHALGLKHPFDTLTASGHENFATLPEVLDTEACTIMSYTNPQETGTEPWFQEGASYYSPFDLLALNYLYGTDGLNGSEGIVYDQHLQLV